MREEQARPIQPELTGLVNPLSPVDMKSQSKILDKPGRLD